MLAWTRWARPGCVHTDFSQAFALGLFMFPWCLLEGKFADADLHVLGPRDCTEEVYVRRRNAFSCFGTAAGGHRSGT
jgi:hypothetical protein